MKRLEAMVSIASGLAASGHYSCPTEEMVPDFGSDGEPSRLPMKAAEDLVTDAGVVFEAIEIYLKNTYGRCPE